MGGDPAKRFRGFLALAGREWKTAWNDRSGYALRAIYAGLLLAGGVIVWGVAPLVYPLRMEEFAAFTRVALAWFFRVQFVLATLLATVTYARAVAREKEQGTMDFLILSPLSRTEILAAKVLGEFFGMLAVLAAGIPVLLFVLPLGGVSLGEVLAAQGILAGHLLAVGGLAAALAAWFARAPAVMIAAWGLLAAFLAGPALSRLLWPGLGWAWSWVETLSPLRVLEQELGDVRTNAGAAWAVLGGGALAGFLFCALGALFLEDRHARRQAGSRDAGFWRRLGRRMARAASSPRMGFLFRPFVPARHPLTRRACAVEGDLAFRIGWIGFVALYAVAIAVQMRIDWDDPRDHLALAGWGAAAALVLAVVQGAVSLGGDRRRGAFEALLAANVEPEDVVRARAAGLAMRASYLVAVPFLHALVVWFLRYDRAGPWELAWRAGLSLPSVVAGIGLAALVTVEISLTLRRPEVAAAMGVVVAVPAAALLAAFLAAHPVTFAAGLPAAAALLFAVYASSVRRFRKAALKT